MGESGQKNETSMHKKTGDSRKSPADDDRNESLT